MTRVWFLHSSLELGIFLEEATLPSLSIRPSTKAFHNAFNIGLNWVTNYKAGLKQGIDLRVGS